ncbi:hypothetical protein D0Z07_8715 [Hyphodiscus hymeniophilus]|uniref:Zn(2)-C6 fungal-type domain-containing protein n=1 Tax=Hyphodiscus hymeniophilus TaxID=353542 RepID=A0A9P6SLT5_9HELO|nr:hypothetical protein D0Z07_8715 [Hyphodiscus hymeniophilus]
MDDFGAWFAPYDYFQQPDFLNDLQGIENFQMDAFPLQIDVPEMASSVEATVCDTPTSSDSFPNSAINDPPSNKRRQTSSPCESESLVRYRKTRKLRAPEQTAKVREKGACYLCQLKRKECQDGVDPEGSCQRCLEHVRSITIIPGLLRPVCWRPNIGYTEIFRRGPTIDFAPTLRGNCEDEGPGKQAVWKHFATRRTGNESTKSVELSQNWTSNTLKIPLERYQPKEGDKQHYAWFDNGGEQHYHTPPYGIANLHVARSSIERFLEEKSAAYIEAHMRNATEITRETFRVAQENKHQLPLVERALKLWVCCRFIEEPWSIVGAEKLGMTTDADPNCPYSDRIPVPPIVDLQIDLIVINELLKPELKIILKMMKTMLESSKPWKDWLEIYLSYFILLHNVELTIAHDLWFVKRNNLKRRYSNKALIDTITQGATTLLTCFHYAHQGYAPFSNPELENKQNWTNVEEGYLSTIRPLLNGLRGDHVNDPAKELFWTSQLHKPDWRPVVLMC